MSSVRTGRRIYYNVFSYVYDAFVNLHARRDAVDTRNFLVAMANRAGKINPAILDICCGTGAVIAAFANCYPESLTVGYDFSRGMLRKAQNKQTSLKTILIEGDAATLPFADGSFDIVTCSHALYELKSPTRQTALQEMKRIIRSNGVVLLMEHEVPHHPLIKILFNIRMMTMGSADAMEFVKGGLHPYQRIFPDVSLYHSPTGKSKLIVCRKHRIIRECGTSKIY
ncbi:MAG: methyltransferase domain-containing protein [Thermodesulfobacteriota bacterium]|nr:methyltransferase domain-containing protein [Thermodesulfobacteriota bacterium]